VPKRRRRSRVPTPAWERERGALGSRVLGRSPQFYATVGVVLVVVVALGLVLYAFGSAWLDDRNRPGSTAIQVGDTKYSVRDYSERLRQYIEQIGGAESQLAQNPTIAMQIVSEEIEEEAIVLGSAQELGLTATDEEVKAEIAQMLTLSGPDDPSFDSRLQEELTKTNVSEAQYRERARAAVLKRKAQEKFTAEVQATAESIHYREILLKTQAEADAALAQIQGGADFAQVAAEKSTDTGAKENGGDKGWVPRGYLDAAREEKVFALEPGGLTTFESNGQFFVYQLLEKQADRPVEEAQKTTIADNSYRKWLEGKRAVLAIQNDLAPGSCDGKKVKWALDHSIPSVNNGPISESLCA
jgi:parvulin-like peptidyl-prolyl isomerase